MKNLECPDCGNKDLAKSAKLHMAFFGSNFTCVECGCSLRAKGSPLNTLIAAAAGSLLFYLIFYGLASGNWWPAVILVLVCFICTTVFSYFLGLGRLGTRRFRL